MIDFWLNYVMINILLIKLMFMKLTITKYLLVLFSIWFVIFVRFLEEELVTEILDIDSFREGTESFLYILFTLIIALWIHFLGVKIYKRLGL